MAYDSTEFPCPHYDLQQADVNKVLKRAREIIEQRGWGKGYACHFTSDGQPYDYCMIGAVGEAAREIDNAYGYGYAPLFDASEERLKDTILKLDNIPSDKFYMATISVPYYNDRVASSKEDVLAVFDKAILNHEH